MQMATSFHGISDTSRSQSFQNVSAPSIYTVLGDCKFDHHSLRAAESTDLLVGSHWGVEVTGKARPVLLSELEVAA